MRWQDAIWCRDLALKGLCRWCRRPIQYPLRVYCSTECRHLFEINHFWWAAAPEALRRAGAARSAPAVCPCGRAAWEVHHKVPLNGQIPRWASCYNHQSNLVPLCFACHVATRRRALSPEDKDRHQLELWIAASADSDKLIEAALRRKA